MPLGCAGHRSQRASPDVTATTSVSAETMRPDQVYSPDLAAALPGPDWLRAVRVDAAARAADTPLPSFEAEEWRYSPIADFSPERFAPAAERPSGSRAGIDIGDVAAAIVTVDGFVVDRHVREHRLEVASAAELDEAVGFAGAIDVFGDANVAFGPDPVVVRVPAGVDIADPIVITHYVTGDGVAVFPRLRVEVGADASVRIVEVFRSDDVSSLVVPVTEISAAPASRVGYQNVQELGPRVWQLGTLAADVAGQATFTGGIVALGGGYARLRTDCRLVGRGATGDLFAAYYGDRDQTLDFRTFQEHRDRDTTSNLVFKGVLDDHSTSIYTGLIRVAAAAAGTNAFQTNRNIKLSEHAWAESVPNLEIENNDVRCSHASTVSPVDPEQRFYLESRGIPTFVAERLMVEGFFREVIARLPVPELAGHLEAAIASKLDARTTTGGNHG